MKNLITITLFCGSIMVANGQARQSSLSLNFTIGRLQIQENALNSLNHDGQMIIPRLSYENISNTGLSHRIVFSYGFGSLKNHLEKERNSTLNNPQIRYSLTKFISRSISVGGYLSGNYEVMNFENWDDSHIYWLTSYQIGPVLKLNNVPVKKIFIELSFPLLAFVSRSRNEITNKVDSDTFSDIWSLIHLNAMFTTFIKYRYLNLQLRYTIFNSGRINLGISSNLKFVHSVIPDTKEFISSSIVIGFLFTYGIN